jgi:hypothetical protein
MNRVSVEDLRAEIRVSRNYSSGNCEINASAGLEQRDENLESGELTDPDYFVITTQRSEARERPREEIQCLRQE